MKYRFSNLLAICLLSLPLLGKVHYVDSLGAIPGMSVDIGDQINTKGFYGPGDGGAATYFVHSDSILNVPVDCITAIPVSSGYAILSADYLKPQYFGAIPDDGLPDHDQIQAMYDFVSIAPNRVVDNNNKAAFGPGINIYFPPGTYRQNKTVYGPTDLQYQSLSISAYGVIIYVENLTDTPIWGLVFNETKGDFSNQGVKINYEVSVEGFTFRGRSNDYTNGLKIAKVQYSQFNDIDFTRLDTALWTAGNYGNDYLNLQFESCGAKNFYATTAEEMFDNGDACRVGFTTNRVINCRVYGGDWKASDSHYEFIGADGLLMEHCVSEGYKPKYNLVLDYRYNTCIAENIVRHLWIESVGTKFYESNAAVWIPKVAYYTQLDRIRGGSIDATDTLLVIDQAVTGKVDLLNIAPTILSRGTDKIVNRSGGGLRWLNITTRGFFWEKDYEDLEDGLQGTLQPDALSVDAKIELSPLATATRRGYYFYSYDPEPMRRTALNISGNVGFLNGEGIAKSRIGMSKNDLNSYAKERPEGVYANNEGFVATYGGRFGWGGYGTRGKTGGLGNALTPLVDYEFRLDSTGMANDALTEKITLHLGDLPQDNDREFFWERNGMFGAKAYGQSFDKSAGTLGKSVYKWAAWAEDGTILHVDPPVEEVLNFTPVDSDDPTGEEGDMACDGQFFYFKTPSGWKRAMLSSF